MPTAAPAVLGAGWAPAALTAASLLFLSLIPSGSCSLSASTAFSLHFDLIVNCRVPGMLLRDSRLPTTISSAAELAGGG